MRTCSLSVTPGTASTLFKAQSGHIESNMCWSSEPCLRFPFPATWTILEEMLPEDVHEGQDCIGQVASPSTRRWPKRSVGRGASACSDLQCLGLRVSQRQHRVLSGHPVEERWRAQSSRVSCSVNSHFYRVLSCSRPRTASALLTWTRPDCRTFWAVADLTCDTAAGVGEAGALLHAEMIQSSALSMLAVCS